MPDTPEVPEAQSDAPSAEQEPHREVSRSPVQLPSQGMSRWAAPVALLVAVVAVALAGWSLISATSNAGATKLPGDPKTRVCTAFNTVSAAVNIQTNLDLGPDPIPQTAVAGNARLALVGGGQYLLNNLDSATPSNLADTVRVFATDLQDIGMYALAGVANTDPVQAGRLAGADSTRQQVLDLCK